MVKVKICGITNKEDALKAAYYGAWAVGFVFHQKSPRYISPSRARKIIEELPPFVTPVGVFVNQNERAVRDVCRFARISTIQLHGDETPLYCTRFRDYKVIKAFRVKDDFNFAQVNQYRVHAYLFDTYSSQEYGGTGETFNWEILKTQSFEKPFILSGGLNPQNIQQALGTLNPYAVDVSSGVEKSPGIKNPRLVKTFFDVISFNPATDTR
ncbi:MAG: phosphoribosylanthranilate isomerase [Candidatus Omnitrophota bacterium]|nr:phosphoribosylanthranilate isomerase [Candidatus Omnitrophota bacterium]